MAESKEKLIAKSYRLPAGDVAFIDKLANRGILGQNASAVLRTLLSYAIKDLVEKDFVKKHRETMEELDRPLDK